MQGQSENNDIKHLALSLMLLIIVTKILGFSREIIISYFYGASKISDAFLISLTIPGSLFSIVGVSISSGYIPMYSHIERDKGQKAAQEFTNHIINRLLVFSLFLLFGLLLFTETIARIYASGFDNEVLMLTVRFTRISAFGVFFTGIVYVLTGYLNIRRSFYIPVLMSLPFNICIVLSVLISYYFSLTLLPIGNALADFLQLAFLIPFAYRAGYRYSSAWGRGDRYLKSFYRLSMPVMVSSVINQINNLADKTIASGIIVGGISALDYANRFNMVLQGIVISSVTTVVFPLIAKQSAENDMSGLKNSVTRAILQINILILPAAAGAMALTEPIIQILYGRGAFDESAIRLTATALFYYSIGFAGYGIKEVLSRAFFSLRDTKTIMINSVIGIVGGILLKLFLTRFIGIGGVSLGSSLIAIITSLILLFCLTRKIPDFSIKELSGTTIRLLLASAVMGIIVSFEYKLLHQFIGLFGAFFTSVATGVVLYILLINLMGVKEAEFIIDLLYKRRRKFKSTLAGSRSEPVCCFMIPGQGYIPGFSTGIIIYSHGNLIQLEQQLMEIQRLSVKPSHIFILSDYEKIEDKVALLLRELKLDIEIGYYSLPAGSGSAEAFYDGIKLAFDKGMDYLWLLKEGTLLHRDSLAVLIDMLRLLKIRCCLISNKTEPFENKELTSSRSRERVIWSEKKIEKNGLFLSRQLMIEVGLPRRELFTCFEEEDYTRRMLAAGYQVYKIRDSLITADEKLQEAPVKQEAKWKWYYYMRNSFLTKTTCSSGNRHFKREQFKLFLLLLFTKPNCFCAILRGYIDGRKGITGRSGRYHT